MKGGHNSLDRNPSEHLKQRRARAGPGGTAPYPTTAPSHVPRSQRTRPTADRKPPTVAWFRGSLRSHLNQRRLGVRISTSGGSGFAPQPAAARGSHRNQRCPHDSLADPGRHRRRPTAGARGPRHHPRLRPGGRGRRRGRRRTERDRGRTTYHAGPGAGRHPDAAPRRTRSHPGVRVHHELPGPGPDDLRPGRRRLRCARGGRPGCCSRTPAPRTCSRRSGVSRPARAASILRSRRSCSSTSAAADAAAAGPADAADRARARGADARRPWAEQRRDRRGALPGDRHGQDACRERAGEARRAGPGPGRHRGVRRRPGPSRRLGEVREFSRCGRRGLEGQRGGHTTSHHLRRHHEPLPADPHRRPSPPGDRSPGPDRLVALPARAGGDAHGRPVGAPTLDRPGLHTHRRA